MKMPKYIKCELQVKSKNELAYTVSIKKWGWPIFLFKAMKKFEGLKWYHWSVFPYICVKTMIRGGLYD